MFSENKRESKAPKFNSGVVSSTNSMNVAGTRRSRLPFDPYASDSSDSPSPLMKFLRSVDPPPPFLTPAKVEEDVIVMDGISVPNSNKGSGEVRLRLPLMPSNSLNCSFVKSNSTAYKNRLCHYWKTSHLCQFGSECQFAHGKEELRHHQFSGKIKLEVSKPNSSFEGSSDSSPSPYGSEFSRNSQVKAAAAEAEEGGEESFSLPPLSPASPIPSEEVSGTSTVPDTTMVVSDWTPRTDGIEVSLPCADKSPSKEEDVGAYMENVLYGAKVKKRLPVFVEICFDF